MNKTVMIIEDNADMQILLLNILRDAGYKTSSVINGKDALTKYAQVKPDIIILDLRLPGLSGKEIMQKLKNDKENVKVICITAYGDHSTEKEMMNLGAYAYFTKPFNNNDLLMTINNVD